MLAMGVADQGARELIVEQSSKLAAFGPNEWLVDEIYQQYLTDRASVDPAWWDFFADYSPADGSSFKTHLDQVNSVHSAPERPQPTSTPTNPPADSPPAPQPSAANQTPPPPRP